MVIEKINKCILEKLHIGNAEDIKFLAYKYESMHFYYNDKEYVIITSDVANKYINEFSTDGLKKELLNDSINIIFVFNSMKEALDYKETKKSLLRIYNDAKIIIVPEEENTNLFTDSKGENYLFYSNKSDTNNCVESKIYNVSLFDLIQLYDRTGYSLFEYNVRVGLNPKDRIRLKEGFLLYFYYELSNKLTDDVKSMLKGLSKSLNNIDSNLQNFENNPVNFWFLHNGISIYVSKYKIEGNKITLFNNDSYVINGAQTLTTIFEIIRSISKIFNKKSIDKQEIINVLKRMYIKTNIIKFKTNNDAIGAITKGLNSQLQITSQGLLTRDKIGIKINNLFINNNINILLSRDGDIGSMSYTPRELMQLYSIYNNKPGRGKNYPSLQTNEDLEIFFSDFSKDIGKLKEFYKCMKFLKKASEWWLKKPKLFLNEKENNQKFHDYHSYGYHYFLWFCKIVYEKSMYENLDFEYLFEKLYDILENVKIKDKEFDFSFNTFRKDEFIKELMIVINDLFEIKNSIALDSLDEKEILDKIGLQGCSLSILEPKEFYFDFSKYQFYKNEEKEDSELAAEMIDDFLIDIKIFKYYEVDKNNNLILINEIKLDELELDKIKTVIDEYVDNYGIYTDLKNDLISIDGSQITILYDRKKVNSINVFKIEYALNL